MAKLESGTRVYGNVVIDTFISATGNIISGNILAGGLLSVGGNIVGANIVTAGNVSGNISGANVISSNTISALANVTGGNILSSGLIRSSNATAGVGYTTGAGLTVTQGTNRATGVTINAVTGAITLFSVAGNTTPTTFTMTNSTVAATDIIILNQKSGTNIYNLLVSNVVAGSAGITVWTTGGVTAEAPVINFAVIKGVTA